MRQALQRKNRGVNYHLVIIFAALVISLVVTLVLILRKEANPEWMRHQKAFFREETKRITKALLRADGTQRKILQERLRYLDRPRYRIKQIVLEDGDRVDRCIRAR